MKSCCDGQCGKPARSRQWLNRFLLLVALVIVLGALWDALG